MNLDEIEEALLKRLRESREWLLIAASGKSFSLTNDEIEITGERGKILFGFQSETGFQTWRLTNYTSEKAKITLELSRNFGAEQTKIELVPRISAGEAAATIELARIDKTAKIARLLTETVAGGKLIRVSLKQEHGRLAQIFIENRRGKQFVAIIDVSETIPPERLLTTAILGFEKLSNRRKNPIEKIWILAARVTARSLQKLLALLRPKQQASIEIFELAANQSGESNAILKSLPHLSLPDLWRGKPSKVSTAGSTVLSETAQKIIAFAPEEIDAVFTRHGETLRFQGLPFARIRKYAGAEKTWFGIESNQQTLNEKSFPEFLELIENLKTYRRYDPPHKRHAFYTLAPESWLEAALRKNIKRLDANLILSPIYNQFRAGRDKIDLLALRRDGRLVIIELKATADREMIFQSLDYWRKIEIERRAGNLQKARFFGEAQIKNEPALIYLAAPMLDFHPDFKFLSETVAPEIEIYRFDLNQNWREDLRVVRQAEASAKRF